MSTAIRQQQSRRPSDLARSAPASRQARPKAASILGNQAQQRLTRLKIQANLRVNPADDLFEQEADRVADQVMRQPVDATQEEEEDTLQAKPLAEQITPVQRLPVQRQVDEEEEEETLQRHTEEEEEEEVLQPKGRDGDFSVDPATAARIRRLAGGQPLPGGSRSFFEARFGRDFGHVRIHSGGDATDTARSIDARAFTHGRHIVFNQGEYRPDSPDGRRLLAHELTHVVQQGQAGESIQRQDGNRGSGAGSAIQAILPAYSQRGDTCGATSLVTALIAWDRQNRTPGQPNEMVTTVLNIVLAWMEQHRSQAIEEWSRRRVNGQAINGQQLFRELTELLTAIRDHTRLPGSQVTEQEFQAIGIALYAMYVDGQAGLSAADIYNLQVRLGLNTPGGTTNIFSYREIWSNSVVRGLGPGQIAQIGWFVRDRGGVGHHVFLIGRFQDGRWFLSDQGTSPATEFTTTSLSALDAAVTSAADRGSYWLFSGVFSGHQPMGWTGAKLLAGPAGVRQQWASLIPNDTFLAQADAGVMTIGDNIQSRDFASTHYDLASARTAAAGVGTSNYGAVIIEMPTGVYSVFKTTLVRTPNMGISAIDTSAGGMLTRRTFNSAELLLSDGSTTHRVSVY